MGVISCPKCSSLNARAGFEGWALLSAVLLLPLAPLLLHKGRKHTVCGLCGHRFR